MSVAETRCKLSLLAVNTTELTAYHRLFPELRGEALTLSTTANY